MTTSQEPSAREPKEPLDALVRRALAPQRPSTEAFARGVRERLDRREADEEARAARLREAPPLLRAAASVLPPVVLPTAVKLAGTAAKPLSWKALPGLAALPVITIGMLFLSFFAGLAQIRRSKPVGTGPSKVEDVVSAWWKRNRVAAWLSIGVVTALFLTQNGEAAFVLLLASMLATAFLFSALARAGVVNRAAVGNTFFVLLFQLGVTLYWADDFVTAGSNRLRWIAPTALLATAVACSLIGKNWSPRNLWQWMKDPLPMAHPDPVSTRFLQCMAWGAVLVGAAGLVLLGWIAWIFIAHWQPSRLKVERRVHEFRAAVDDGASWKHFLELAHSIGIDRARENGFKFADDAIHARDDALEYFSSTEQVSLIALGLANREQLERIADEYDPTVHALRVTQFPSIMAGVALGRIPSTEQRRLTERLVDAAVDDGQLTRLDHALALVTLLDALDAEASLVALTPFLRELCREHYFVWGSGGYHPATFTDRSRLDEDSFWTRLVPSTVSPSDTEENFLALAILDHVGPPETIEYARIYHGLDQLIRPPVIERWKEQNKDLEALQCQVLASPYFEAPSLWQSVLRERVLLAAIALSILCVVAVLHSPVETEESSS